VWNEYREILLSETNTNSTAPRNQPRRNRPIVIAGIVLTVLGLAAWAFISTVNRAITNGNMVKCEDNMKVIGYAIRIYLNDYGGVYPPDFGTMLKAEHEKFENEHITAACFTCPATLNSPPDGMTTDQAADWVNKNADYIYIGASLPGNVPDASIIAFEKDSNHGDGMNVLFADGHVEFMKLPDAHAAIDRSKMQRPSQSN
jgi:prepilin-type processing-associated H-X9-DG protein